MRSTKQLAPLGALLAAALATQACAGKPFDVKTIPAAPSDSLAARSAIEPLAVRASPVWDEDWLLENFDANLILAGVLPVRVEIENRSGAPLEVRKVKAEVLTSAGAKYKRLDAKKAMKRIEGYYEITLTSVSGRERYRADFLMNALDLEAPLAGGERRQGFVFFALPEAARKPAPLTLRVESKSGAATLALPAGRD